VNKSQKRVRREDPASLAATSAHVDLVEMFFQLARVKASVCAEIGRSLRARHGLTFEAFDAVTVISEQPEGCDQHALASALGLPPDETRAIIDSLVACGYARRTPRTDGAKPAAVILTLRGTVVLSRAGRTVDEALDRRIGSALSLEDRARLEDALAALRQRPVPVAEPVSSHARHRRQAVRRA
jgi:DNA-binding MarR family transcriptional regulator